MTWQKSHTHTHTTWPKSHTHIAWPKSRRVQNREADLVEGAVLVILGETVLLQEVVLQEAGSLQSDLVPLCQGVLHQGWGGGVGQISISATVIATMIMIIADIENDQ